MCGPGGGGGSIRPIRSKGTVPAAMGSHYPGRLRSGLGDDLGECRHHRPGSDVSMP